MKLQHTKDFLYQEWDIDRLERELRTGVQKPALSYMG